MSDSLSNSVTNSAAPLVNADASSARLGPTPTTEAVQQFTGMMHEDSKENSEGSTEKPDSQTQEARLHHRLEPHGRHQVYQDPALYQQQDNNPSSNQDNNNLQNQDDRQQHQMHREGHHAQRHGFHQPQADSHLFNNDSAMNNAFDGDADAAGGGGAMRQQGMSNNPGGGDQATLDIYRDPENTPTPRDTFSPGGGGQQPVNAGPGAQDLKHQHDPVLQHPAPPHLVPLLNRWLEERMAEGNQLLAQAGQARHSFARTIFGFALVFALVAGFAGFQYLLHVKDEFDGDFLAQLESGELRIDDAAPHGQPREMSATRRAIFQQLQDSAIVVVSGEYFIGIVYQKGVTPLPVILHKEYLQEAGEIMRYARQHDIPLFRNDQLARELWRSGKLDQFIPRSTSARIARLFVKAAYERSRRQPPPVRAVAR